MLKQLFRDFVLLCRSVDLIDGAVVAIDGAFLRANASKNQLISEKVTRKDMASVDEKITEYLAALEYSEHGWSIWTASPNVKPNWVPI